MKIDVKEFIGILNLLRPGTDKKETVNHSNLIGFQNDYIYSYNDNVAVSKKYTTGLEGYVDAATLYALMTKVNDKVVDIEVEPYAAKNNTPNVDDIKMKYDIVFHIKGKRFSATLNGSKITNLRNLNTNNINDSDFTKLPSNFVNMLSSCRLAVDTDMSAPVLTCFNWSNNGLQSCDNYRVSNYKQDFKEIGADNLLLPFKYVQQLIKYKPVRYYIFNDKSSNSFWAHFDIQNGCVFSFRCYSGVFPEIAPILDIDKGGTIIFPDSMIDVLQRAAIFAQDQNTDSGSEQVKIEIKDKMFSVQVKKESRSFIEKGRIRCDLDFAFEVRIQALIDILNETANSKATIDKSLGKIKFDVDGMVYIISLLPVS